MGASRIAIATWRKQPAACRKMVLDYFMAEAEQSREWAKEAPLFGKASDLIAEAVALESAVAVLRGLARRPRR